MNLKDKLRLVYPSLADSEIEKWYEVIKTHADIKLPKTEKIEQYAEVDAQIKELTIFKTNLRDEIIKDYNLIGEHPFDGINISTTNNNKFDESGFFDYMAKQLKPELLEQITKKEIDYNNLYKLEAKGMIQLDELPSELLIEKAPGYRVEVAGIRGKKNEGNV